VRDTKIAQSARPIQVSNTARSHSFNIVTTCQISVRNPLLSTIWGITEVNVECFRQIGPSYVVVGAKKAKRARIGTLSNGLNGIDEKKFPPQLR
jgi:hypothetical protein